MCTSDELQLPSWVRTSDFRHPTSEFVVKRLASQRFVPSKIIVHWPAVVLEDWQLAKYPVPFFMLRESKRFFFLSFFFFFFTKLNPATFVGIKYMVDHLFLIKMKIFALKMITNWLLTFQYMNASTWLDLKLTLRLTSERFLSFSA